MTIRALLFDVDGTLADTEREGHLPACNEAFATLGLPVRWSWDEFLAMQHVPGNLFRMRMALEALEPALPRPALEDAVKRLAELKRRLYIERYLPRLTLRPGVVRLVSEALDAGLLLAVVTTTDEPQVEALLRSLLPDAAASFRPVLGKMAGRKTAPESPLHHRCLAELGIAPREALAIEDSEYGAQAARRAGIPVAVFYNHYTFGQDFRGAALVARSLEHFDLAAVLRLCDPE